MTVTLNISSNVWNKRDVINFIMTCRRDEGIPMFKTRFAGRRFPRNGVMAICWGGKGMAPDSMMFINVPEDELRFLEENVGDWRRLLKKYNPRLLKEAERYYVRFRGKLPRFVGGD